MRQKELGWKNLKLSSSETWPLSFFRSIYRRYFSPEPKLGDYNAPKYSGKYFCETKIHLEFKETLKGTLTSISVRFQVLILTFRELLNVPHLSSSSSHLQGFVKVRGCE